MRACVKNSSLRLTSSSTPLTMVRRSRSENSIQARVLDRLNVDLRTRFWQYGLQRDRAVMRIASSPTFRIATGLLLAALLSIVGYQVFRRWISHGPEALLERADDSSWHLARLESSLLSISRRTTPPCLRGPRTRSRSQHLFTPRIEVQSSQ